MESALASLNDFLGAVDDLVRGIPLICLILFGGIFLTIRVGGLPFVPAAVWTIADIFNGLMAIPNMIALLALSGVVARETRSFLTRLAANGGHEEGMEPYVNDLATRKSGAPE